MRRNYLLHVALASVLILVAAFAGQVRKWQKEWRSIQIMPGAAKKHEVRDRQEAATTERTLRAELLVKFREDVSQQTIEEITGRLEDRVEDGIESVPGLMAVDDLNDGDVELVAAEYRTLSEVEYAEPNFEIRLEHETGGTKHIHPVDPRFTDQWGLSNEGQGGGKSGADISAMQAWAVTTGNDDIVIAVLDSGVAYDHEDLVNNMWKRPANLRPYQDTDFGVVEDDFGYNALNNSGDPYDDNGHGTHCAGIIGAEGGNNIGITGVNWRVQIMPLKFMNAGGFGNVKDAIEAINYVIDRKKAGVNVRVISASWGSMMRSRALGDVIQKAYSAGILFVAAAGNAGVNNDRQPQFPAGYPDVISVAALDRFDQLAQFSNYGSKSVTIAAPGKEILSTWLGNDYEEHSGTSMATPVVAGVAGLALSANPDLSVSDLRSLMLKSVDKLPSITGKVSNGRINAAKAVGAQ